MNGTVRLPGFEGLFWVNRRLANKLTSDELRSIREYITERLLQEQAELLFRLEALQTNFDVTVRQSTEAITELHEELDEKKEILKHYAESDQNILNVYRQREGRWEKKQTLLLTELEKQQSECNGAKEKLNEVEKDLQSKTVYIQELEAKLVETGEAILVVDEAKKIVQERDNLKTDILRLKLEIDKRDRQIRNYQKELNSLRSEHERYSKENQFGNLKIDAMQKELQKQMSEVAEKCKELTETQLKLHVERRQAETLRRQLCCAADDVTNYQHLIRDIDKPSYDPRDPHVITLKKDLDIMDIRLKSVDTGIRRQMEDVRTITDQMDVTKQLEKLAQKLKSEVYVTGETVLETTVLELVKRLDKKHKSLNHELMESHNWNYHWKVADTLKSQLAALRDQARSSNLSDLAHRAAKQIQKLDLIMRGTSGVKITQVYTGSRKVNSSNNNRAFLTASTPSDNFNMTSTTNSSSSSTDKSPLLKVRKCSRNGRLRPILPAQEVGSSDTDGSKLQYVDTKQIDLSLRTPSSSLAGSPTGLSLAPLRFLKSASSTQISAIGE